MYASDRRKPLIIARQTTISKLPHKDLAETLHSVSERIPGSIAPDILDNFVAENRHPHQLSNQFNVNIDYLLLSKDDLDRIFLKGDGWSEFNISYRGRGIIDFSRVGFNHEVNQALVYTSILSGPKTGSGYYVLLVKENNVWIIKHKAEVWVS